MASKEQKKEQLREAILNSAKAYSENLVGKDFLYVVGDQYFEVSFPKDRFLHLTGVQTSISAADFYRFAKNRKLSSNQFYLTATHNFYNAKKKLSCLPMLHDLTTTPIRILYDYQTSTLTYKLCLTNETITLCLSRNTDQNGNETSEVYFPISLRINDHAVTASKCEDNGVDFIFTKDTSKPMYSTLLMSDTSKTLTDRIQRLIHPDFYRISEQRKSQTA